MRTSIRTLLTVLLGATALSALAPAVHAQDAATAATPTQNAVVNLINALVHKGVLSQAEADQMIAQAEAEAAQVQSAAKSAQTALAAAAPASSATTQGTSVRYVPSFVRDEITQEVRAQVIDDVKKQGLVAPDAMPDWVRHIKITGDMRLRDEQQIFDNGNAYDFVNIGAINAGTPYNTDPVSNPFNPPIINTQKNRNYLRLRARLNVEADIFPDLTAYMRLATGSDNSPVSTNQTLGGYDTKKDLWLDRAYIDYNPALGTHIYAGRMANPFRLTELVWDEDVNLDGVAGTYQHRFGNAVSAYVTGGVFPLDYIDGAFPKTSAGKVNDGGDKWLFAAQIGGDWLAADALRTSAHLAYYDFQNVEGALSPACSNLADYCLTDYTRPGFAQRGNTLFALRDITTSDPANQAAPQYYGLASKFKVIDLSGDVEWAITDGLHPNVTAHVAKNLGYKETDVLARGFNPARGVSQIANNNETCGVALVGGLCPTGGNLFISSPDAWLLRATLGSPKVAEAGDWSVSASYRHLGADSLLDAFTDSDFHLGGTNAKGWTVEGSYGLRRNTSFTIRWINSEEISGPVFRVNLLQSDVKVAF